jgi:hypothetical protein
VAEALKQTWTKKVVVVGLVTAACHTGTARGQLRPGDLAASQGPTYVVEGIALGANIKADSSTYREYKCGPSDQFNGFTWCQRSRRDTERRGSFDATYSILHSKDGAVVYANRTQQPAFLEASKADRDIQSYSRKFGHPKITKMPRRSGTSDAIMATWGKIELEPLDNESLTSLAQGKSPKKGLLVDFFGNFTRSAQEGAPIYRIVGGAGFVWVGNFDKKGRGTLRVAAVDASALQPGPVATQVFNASQNDDQQPQGDDQRPGKDQAQLPSVTTADDQQPQGDGQRPGKDQAQLPSVTTGSDVEATIARLQTELAAAVKAKGEADRARTDAEKAARQARTDAEIARREFEAAINAANAAKAGIEKLRNAGGRSASYVTEIILIGAFLVVLFLIRLFSRMAAASSEARDVQNADIGLTCPDSSDQG